MATIQAGLTGLPEHVLDREAARDGIRYEFIDGQILEKPPMGMEAGAIAQNLLLQIGGHIRGRQMGVCCGSQVGYRIFRDDPARIRYPDGSFVRSDRLPDGKPFRGHSTVAPDLAIEVVSPNDNAENVEQRIGDLLGSGVRLTWVIYPDSRRIGIRRPDGSAAFLDINATLSGEDVLPGFACTVSVIFELV